MFTFVMCCLMTGDAEVKGYMWCCFPLPSYPKALGGVDFDPIYILVYLDLHSNTFLNNKHTTCGLISFGFRETPHITGI